MKTFRGSAGAARHYVEANRSRADDYYLAEGTGVAERYVASPEGGVRRLEPLTGDSYEAWVAGVDPGTGVPKGRLRHDDQAVRFVEVVLNGPKSWSLAGALHPDVSAAYDAAQDRAAVQIIGWLAEHATTRVGPRGGQVQLPVQVEAVTVRHHTSRAGDPHRHLHLQVNARACRTGAWRGLHTVGVRDSLDAVNGIGHAAVMTDPGFRPPVGRPAVGVERRGHPRRGRAAHRPPRHRHRRPGTGGAGGPGSLRTTALRGSPSQRRVGAVVDPVAALAADPADPDRGRRRVRRLVRRHPPYPYRPRRPRPHGREHAHPDYATAIANAATAVQRRDDAWTSWRTTHAHVGRRLSQYGHLSTHPDPAGYIAQSEHTISTTRELADTARDRVAALLSEPTLRVLPADRIDTERDTWRAAHTAAAAPRVARSARLDANHRRAHRRDIPPSPTPLTPTPRISR